MLSAGPVQWRPSDIVHPKKGEQRSLQTSQVLTHPPSCQVRKTFLTYHEDQAVIQDPTKLRIQNRKMKTDLWPKPFNPRRIENHYDRPFFTNAFTPSQNFPAHLLNQLLNQSEGKGLHFDHASHARNFPLIKNFSCDL
jgi:hypothetical protein